MTLELALYRYEVVKDMHDGASVDDYAPSMGAALAYYTPFSIAPLLITISDDRSDALAVLHVGQQAGQFLPDHGVALARAGLQSGAIKH
jgi:hypothetical protein